jgi:undecaprenyl diphosphate synthase
MLPRKVREKLEGCMEKLSTNTGLKVILAISYSSKWEIIGAVKQIVNDATNGVISSSQITCELFERYLSTAGIPDPELLIRTSGEYRLSNFLLWQIAYAELYFTDKLWPDFRKEDLFAALVEFQSRERRFGMTSEQIAR